MKKLLLFLFALITVMTVKAANPDLYIRGAQFGWNSSDCTSSNKMTCNNGVYTITLDKLQSGFKIATNDWSNYNFGSASDVETYSSYTLTNDSGSSNITTKDAATLTNVKITFTLSTKVMKITETTYPDAIYLAGDFNGWNEKDDTYKLTRESDTNKYVISNVNIDSGKLIKFTAGVWSRNWGSENTGDIITVGSTFKPNFNGNNYKLGETLNSAKVEFNYDLDDLTNATVKITNVSVPDQLYIAGNINGGSWDNANAPALTRSGNKYTIEGVTIQNTSDYAYFTFITTRGTTSPDWDTVNSGDRYGAEASNTTLTDGSATMVKYTANVNASGAHSWKVDNGVYNVEADFETMTVTLTKTESLDPIVVIPDALYIAGYVNGSDWNNTSAPLAMTKDGTSFKASNVTLKGSTNDGAYFSFITTTGDSWEAVNKGDRYGASSEDENIVAGTASTVVKYVAGDAAAAAFSWLAPNAIYDISVDFKTYKVTLTQVGTVAPIVNMPDQLYLAGTFNGADWELANASAMTKSGNTYTIEGVTLQNTTDLAYFSFITATGDSWDAVNKGDRYGAEEEGQQLESGSAAKMVKYTADVDASAGKSWSVPNGIYTIVADFENMTVTATLSEALDRIIDIPEALYMVGDVNGSDWNNTSTPLAMTKEGNSYKASKVTLKVTAAENIGSHRAETSANPTFSFITTTADSWDEVNKSDRYGAATENENISDGTATTFKKYEGGQTESDVYSWQAASAVYDIEVNFESDELTIVKVDDLNNETEVEMPDALYVVGDVNGSDWNNTSTPLEMSKDGNTFKADNVTLQGSTAAFFSFTTTTGADWDAVNNSGDRYGAATADEDIVSGTASTMVKFALNVNASGANSWKAENAIYNIVADFENMTVTITKVGDVKDEIDMPEQLYILGEVNGNSWAPNVGIRMSKNTTLGTFTLSSVQLTSTSYFNFAINLADTYDDLNVDGNRYGWDEDQMLNVGVTSSAMSQINNPKAACVTDVDSDETYDITVDWVAKTVVVSRNDVVGVDGINPDEVEAEYFTLQGVKVINPTAGIYIVRRGNKVTKEVIRK